MCSTWDLLFGDEIADNRRPRRIHERARHIDEYDEVKFQRRFRFCKEAALCILDRIEDKLEYSDVPTCQNSSHSDIPSFQVDAVDNLAVGTKDVKEEVHIETENEENARSTTELSGKEVELSLANTQLKSKERKKISTTSDTGQVIGNRNGKIYKCEICQNVFPGSKSLNVHLRVHTDDKPYKCAVCNKAFTQNGHLKFHLRVHSCDKPYQCEVCSKAFSSNNQLRVHLSEHPDVKPFKCCVCSKAFSQNGNLQKHLRVHSGDKPYKCDVCSKAFTRKDQLIVHLSEHTGVKPYKCDVCSKAFSYNSVLKTHLRMHTGDKPYKCEVCCKAFSDKSNLRIHLRVHKNDDPDNVRSATK